MNSLKKKFCFHLAYFTSSLRRAIQSFVNNTRKREEKNETCPFRSISYNSWKPRNSGLVCSESSGFHADSGHIHSIISYPTMKRRTAYFLNIFQLKSQSFVTLSSTSRCPFAPGYHPLSLSRFFFDPRPSTPFISGFCLSSRKKRQKERKRNRYTDFSPTITSLLFALYKELEAHVSLPSTFLSSSYPISDLIISPTY